MNTHADKTPKNQSRSVADEIAQKQSSSESTFQFVDYRPVATQMRKLQEGANHSPQVSQLSALQEVANNSPQVKQATQVQAMADHDFFRQQPNHQEENHPGLPAHLKAGIENLSGYSMDDVSVH